MAFWFICVFPLVLPTFPLFIYKILSIASSNKEWKYYAAFHRSTVIDNKTSKSKNHDILL